MNFDRKQQLIDQNNSVIKEREKIMKDIERLQHYIGNCCALDKYYKDTPEYFRLHEALKDLYEQKDYLNSVQDAINEEIKKL